MNEVWRDIEGYESFYEISDRGRVKVCRNGVYLKRTAGSGGYLSVSLSREGIKKTHSVHRLVAKAFIANAAGVRTVNHIDEDPSNNCISNLEWCTDQYNIEYSQAKKYKFTNPSGQLVEIFNLRKLCRESGLNRGNMTSVASGKREQHKGWRLGNE